MSLHQISIPPILRNLTSQRDTVEAAGSTIGEIIENLDTQYPTFADRLLENNRLRRNVLVYVNGEDVRFLAERETPVKDDDEICILSLSAGG